MAMEDDQLARLEAAIGIEFADKELLKLAFIHRSYLNESLGGEVTADNERLEFLGDAVLAFVMSEHLYRNYPDHQEGKLTRLRSALVRRDTLARAAQTLGLGGFLLLGKGEEEGGGRSRPAILCAVFEALLGAIFLDQGIDKARGFAAELLQPKLDLVEENAVVKDPKSRLQEYVQMTYNLTPRYRTCRESGPDHDKRFVRMVLVNKKAIGLGEGYTKQEGDQAAAAMALQRLGQPAPEYVERADVPCTEKLVEPATLP